MGGSGPVYMAHVGIAGSTWEMFGDWVQMIEI